MDAVLPHERNASVEIMLVSAEPDLVNRPRLYEPDPGPHLRHPLAPNPIGFVSVA